METCFPPSINTLPLYGNVFSNDVSRRVRRARGECKPQGPSSAENPLPFVIEETGEVIDDGLYEIFVNTTIDDGSDIADLMSCFTKKEVKNPKFPALSKRVTELKEDKGGYTAMSKIMDEYLAEQKVVWRKAEHIETIAKMIQKGFTKEVILDLDYTEEEYSEAEKSLLTSV